MKIVLILSFLFCTARQSLSQQILWDSTSDWKMYDVHDFDAFNYTISDLDAMKTINLNVDTMQFYLNSMEVWPTEKTSVWMGLYLATCRLPNGQIRKIEISVYGGFLYDELQHTYYQVAEDRRQDWLAYLSQKSLQLQDTIPEENN